ncbi:MAG: GntR family transcriptional regulator [Solobacterium sp.]|nr:GntR family transcriptional regulator [Solobacterium sp.]
MNQTRSKVDEIYNYILSEIAKLNYKPGDRIIISQVAKACQTSEIPVREALRRIESEGYVVITANKGATVVGITKKLLNNIAEVSGTLEGYATRCAIDYLSPASIRELRRINEEMHQAYINQNDEEYSKLNQDFHYYIFSYVPNKYLINLIEQLWERWVFMASAFTLVPARMSTSYEEHLNLINLIEQQKYDEAEVYAREHKTNALVKWIGQIPDIDK